MSHKYFLIVLAFTIAFAVLVAPNILRHPDVLMRAAMMGNSPNDQAQNPNPLNPQALSPKHVLVALKLYTVTAVFSKVALFKTYLLLLAGS